MIDSESPRLLSPTDTAKRVAMSWRTVSRRVREGSFPAPLRLGPAKIAFLTEEVDHWLETRPRTTEIA